MLLNKRMVSITILLSLSLSLILVYQPVKATTAYWTKDKDFNNDDTYWMPEVLYWEEGGTSHRIDMDNENYARFEIVGTDHIAHLRLDKVYLWGMRTYVARVVQGWVWGDVPSKYKKYWPDPLSLDGVTDLKLKTTVTWSTAFAKPPLQEAAVLVNVWFKINNVDVLKDAETWTWVHYGTIIFGADLYFLHVGTPLRDHQLRQSTTSNGLPVFVYTRFFWNQASGTFTIDLINDILLDAINQNLIKFNLADVTLYEVEAVVEECNGYAEAKFTSLSVYYTFSGSNTCPTLGVYSNSTWVSEGVLDIHTGALYNRDVIYHHYLVAKPDLIMHNFYLLKLSELDEHTSYIDRVQLMAINDNGTAIYLPLVMAFERDNRSVTRFLRYSDDVWLVLRPGDEVYLLFYYNGVSSDSWRLMFIIEGHNPKGIS